MKRISQPSFCELWLKKQFVWFLPWLAPNVVSVTILLRKTAVMIQVGLKSKSIVAAVEFIGFIAKPNNR
jgi:hypothetical protein